MTIKELAVVKFLPSSNWKRYRSKFDPANVCRRPPGSPYVRRAFPDKYLNICVTEKE